MSLPLGRPIATGRTSDIFAWGDHQVVKVFHDSGPEAGTGTAAAIAKEVHDSVEVHTLGITPIRCHGTESLPDGRVGIVFDRVDGDALTTVAERRPYRIPAVARTLAREHVGIHTHRSTAFTDVRAVAADLLDTAPLAALTESERRRVGDRIMALPAGDTVLHLDFHPLNVFEHHDDVVTIDWQSTASGVPAADVAATRLLFTEAELFPGISPLQRVVYQSVRRVMLRFYLSEYQRLTGIGPADITPWMLPARVLRLGWLDVESERDDLLARIRADIAEEGRK